MRSSSLVRRNLALAAATSLIATMGACGGSEGSSSSEEWVLGASLPFTGPTTAYGANLAGGMEAYIDYVNEQGGVLGKKIKLEQVDGGFDTATTVQSLKKLAQSDPIAIGGLLISSATEGALSTIEALGIPALVSSPVSTFNRPPKDELIFGAGGPISEDEAFMISDFAQANIVEGMVKPRVVTMSNDTNGGQLFSKNMKAIASDNAWDLQNQVVYTVGTTNFDAQAAKIVAAKPDLVVYAADASNAVFIKALKEAGLKAPIITTQGGPHADEMATIDYAPLYVGREIVYPIGDEPAVKDYLARVKKVGGTVDENSHITQYGYLQAQIFVKVLEKCGKGCDKDAFLRTLSETSTLDTDGFTFGPVKYSKDSTAGLDTESVYSWDKANKKVVLETGTYTYPK